jgi:hypothetical protein
LAHLLPSELPHSLLALRPSDRRAQPPYRGRSVANGFTLTRRLAGTGMGVPQRTLRDTPRGQLLDINGQSEANRTGLFVVKRTQREQDAGPNSNTDRRGSHAMHPCAETELRGPLDDRLDGHRALMGPTGYPDHAPRVVGPTGRAAAHAHRPPNAATERLIQASARSPLVTAATAPGAALSHGARRGVMWTPRWVHFAPLLGTCDRRPRPGLRCL